MSLMRKISQRAKRRALRVRKSAKITLNRPRVSIHKSLLNIYAQVIDDAQQKTIVSFSTLELAQRSGDKKSQAREVGLALAKKAREHGVESVWFDRGSSKYHGRVKELADGLREGGLKF